MRGEPGDQFDGLRPLPRGDGPIGAAHLDAAEERHDDGVRHRLEVVGRGRVVLERCGYVVRVGRDRCVDGRGFDGRELRRHVIHPDQRLLGVVQDGEHGIDVGTVEPDRRHGDRSAGHGQDPLVGFGGQPGRCVGESVRPDGRHHGDPVAGDGELHSVGMLGAVVIVHQDDRRLPHLAARAQGPQFERRPLVLGRRPDERRGEFERRVDRIRPVGVAVSEQHLVRHRDRDEVGDFGIQRGGQPGGDAPNHGVGLTGLRVDRQGASGLEIDQDVGAIVVDAELDEGDAWHADPPRRLAEQLDRDPCREMPQVAVAGPRSRRCGDTRQGERDLALGRHLHRHDLHVGVDEGGGRRTARYVDARRPLARIDPPEEQLGVDHLPPRFGYPAPGGCRTQPLAPTDADEHQDSGGEHRRVFEPDR